MIPVHKPPVGFLGGLDLKTVGRVPDELEQAIRGGFDLTDLYLAANLRRIATTMTIAGGSGATVLNTGLRIPQGQNWRIIGASMSSAIAAADVAITVNALFGVTAAANPADTTLIHGGVLMIGNTLFRAAGFTPNRPIYLPSGWVVTFNITTSAAPSQNLTTTCEVLAQVLPD